MHEVFKQPNRAYAAFIAQVLESIPAGTPIFTNEITDVVVEQFKMDRDRARKIVNTNLNRLNGKIIEHFRKGVYYKPKVTVFGKTPLNPAKIVQDKYIKQNEKVVGYETGASLLQKLGLTTQIPKYQYIATNLVINHGTKVVDEFNVVLRKPKMEINEDNYMYLQVLDAVENKDDVIIDSKNPYEILNDYLNQNGLDFGKLVAIANKVYTKHVLQQIVHIAEETRF